MSHSLTYYLTLFVLKLKGVKKDFSQDPIDYKKIRKTDIHSPKGSFFTKNNVRKFEVLKTQVTEIGPSEKSDRLLIFVHGGAFVAGPGQHHWDTVKTISRQTGFTIWMCDYPKAPETKISEISENMDAVYRMAIDQYHPTKLQMIGDSVGGTLIAALVQRLVTKKIELPRMITLVSPVMDARLVNPEAIQFEAKDPMLSKKGVVSAKKMCAENENLSDPMISPLLGHFEGFPKTILYLAENDITFPDQKLAAKKLENSGVDLDVIEGEGMPHIWPFLPVMKESKEALTDIIERMVF